MSEGVFLNGLWIPAREERRFSQRPVFEGRIDLDAKKTMRATKFCRERRRALDVGAHVGATTCMLADRFEAVDAFEVVPEIVHFLERNTAALDNVAVHEIAASDREGELHFEYLQKHSQLTHQLKEGEEPLYAEKEKGRSIVVGPIPAMPLDSFGFDDVSFIKIDVEGSEIEVVRGLEQTIQRCRPVILIEQAENEVMFHGGKKHEASALLEDFGMTQETSFVARHDRVFVFQD